LEFNTAASFQIGRFSGIATMSRGPRAFFDRVGDRSHLHLADFMEGRRGCFGFIKWPGLTFYIVYLIFSLGGICA
jgi:hypothetical protein